jgi:predicted DNA binding CopG/RHH family protein
MSKQLKEIPAFTNEVQEPAFWETHDSTDYLDWSKAQSVVLPNLKPTRKTISLRLPQHLLDYIKAAANARDVTCLINRSLRCGCRKSCMIVEDIYWLRCENV